MQNIFEANLYELLQSISQSAEEDKEYKIDVVRQCLDSMLKTLQAKVES